jgi:hypothetical protein
MLFPFSALEVAAVAGLLTLVWLRWRFERRCLASALRYAQTRRELRVEPLLAPIEPGNRGNRALAMTLASIAWKGAEHDFEDIISLADEILQYIEGNDDALIPRADKPSKGRIPR